MEGEGISESQEREQMTRGLRGEGGRWREETGCVQHLRSSPPLHHSACYISVTRAHVVIAFSWEKTSWQRNPEALLLPSLGVWVF